MAFEASALVDSDHVLKAPQNKSQSGLYAIFVISNWINFICNSLRVSDHQWTKLVLKLVNLFKRQYKAHGWVLMMNGVKIPNLILTGIHVDNIGDSDEPRRYS